MTPAFPELGGGFHALMLGVRRTEG
jgi:hypothetical protein